MNLASLVSHVIGVDTHKDTHTAAVVLAATAGVVATETRPANTAGYDALVELADTYTEPAQRVWAIEGTGSYGAGLAAYLEHAGEWVLEVDRPKRPAARNGAKSDDLDAARAAREMLGRTRWATPRARGEREALRVLVVTREGAVRDRTRAINQLKALIVSAPDELRDRLRDLDHDHLAAQCGRLRDRPSYPIDYRSTVAAIVRTAHRIHALDREIRDHDRDLRQLTKSACPQLRAEYGVGPIVAANTYIAWSHPGRCRSEAAFASLGGTAPIEASSGQVTRVRLNRGGDRQLNRALHTVVLTRARSDPATQAYIARRLAEGKSERDARRCLKRYLARHFYRLLEHPPDTTTETTKPLDET